MGVFVCVWGKLYVSGSIDHSIRMNGGKKIYKLDFSIVFFPYTWKSLSFFLIYQMTKRPNNENMTAFLFTLGSATKHLVLVCLAIYVFPSKPTYPQTRVAIRLFISFHGPSTVCAKSPSRGSVNLYQGFFYLPDLAFHNLRNTKTNNWSFWST